mgnify:CR=1 FL=1
MIRGREVRRMAAILCMITGNDSSSRICGSSGDIRSGTGMESDLGKVVLPYGKRCLEHRFYRR